MCVRSGDTLDDNGPVLWCGAAVWSQVKRAPSPAACLRFDLISIVISLNCISRAENHWCFFLSYSHMHSCLRCRHPFVASCFCIICGALGANFPGNTPLMCLQYQSRDHVTSALTLSVLVPPGLSWVSVVCLKARRSGRTAYTMFWGCSGLTPYSSTGNT